MLLGKRPDFGPVDDDDAKQGTFPQHRNTENSPEASNSLIADPIVFGVGQYVGDVNHSPLQSCPSRDAPSRDRRWIPLHELLVVGGDAVRDHRAETPTVLLEEEALVGLTKTGRVLNKRLQYRLEVERRSADDLQDLACGGLLLQGLGQLAVPGLELLEQTHVLDGDHRLVGERLEERRLLVG